MTDDNITEYPPDIDIDDYIENCNFRIERMSDEGVWLAAYTNDSDGVNHHYDISCGDDGGLHISHREEGGDNT